MEKEELTARTIGGGGGMRGSNDKYPVINEREWEKIRNTSIFRDHFDTQKTITTAATICAWKGRKRDRKGRRARDARKRKAVEGGE